MDRFFYETRSGGPRSNLRFDVFDNQRRTDTPIASCRERDDAEQIVVALNRMPVVIGMDFGSGDFSAEWPLRSDK